MDLVNRLRIGKENAKAKRERNKYKRLYFRFCDTTSSDEYDPYSDSEIISEEEEEEALNEASNDISDEEEEQTSIQNPDVEVNQLDLHNKKIKKRIFDNIISNIGKDRAARFTGETKLFAYTLFSKSPSAYEYLRKIFPFPSETILHDNFSSAVTEHKKDLTDISKIQKRFEYQKKVYNLNNEKIKCVLAVDAFAGTVMKRIKSEDDTDNCKHIFLFLVCPLDKRYKPFIIHLKKTLTGNGCAEIDSLICTIQEQSKKTNFPIRYCAFDGDSHYSHFFRSQFDFLFKLINDIEDINELNERLDELDFLFITDPLHLWKNQRTRVLVNKIVVNPYKKSRSITGLDINKILNLGPVLTDFSQLSKMRDNFAVALFNLKNANELLTNYSEEGFFFFFINSLWVEALLNEHISPQNRTYLLTILLKILCSIYNKLKENSLPQNVSFRKSSKNEFLTMFTIEKLERIIPTILVTRYEICQGNLYLGLDRIGTHVAENKIGNIRSLVHQDETIGKLIHLAAKNDFITTLSKADDVIKKTRLNQGGVCLNIGMNDEDFGGTASQIADLLLHEVGFIEKEPEDFNIDMKKFHEKLQNFIEKNPYNPKVSYTKTNSVKIINRYRSLGKELDFTPVNNIRHNWTPQEIGIIDNFLLNGIENQISSILPYIQPPALQLYIAKRKTELAMRPVSQNEALLFNYLIQKRMKLKDIASFLSCRTANSLKKLFRL